MERTLSIIKPDAVAKQVIGDIIRRFESEGLRVVAMKMVRLTKKQAQGFYIVHERKPFFDSVTDFMSSGPVVVMILEGPDAIGRNRAIMGVTDPGKAEEGAIRKLYGSNVESNAVHGSDSPETAAFEIRYFFNELEIA